MFKPYLPAHVRETRESGPWASDEGMEGLFAAAGLSQVQTVTRTLTASFESDDQWYAFSWSHGQRAIWERILEEQRPAVRAQAERTLDATRDAKGRISLTQDIRLTLGRR